MIMYLNKIIYIFIIILNIFSFNIKNDYSDKQITNNNFIYGKNTNIEQFRIKPKSIELNKKVIVDNSFNIKENDKHKINGLNWWTTDSHKKIFEQEGLLYYKLPDEYFKYIDDGWNMRITFCYSSKFYFYSNKTENNNLDCIEIIDNPSFVIKNNDNPINVQKYIGNYNLDPNFRFPEFDYNIHIKNFLIENKVETINDYFKKEVKERFFKNISWRHINDFTIGNKIKTEWILEKTEDNKILFYDDLFGINNWLLKKTLLLKREIEIYSVKFDFSLIDNNEEIDLNKLIPSTSNKKFRIWENNTVFKLKNYIYNLVVDEYNELFKSYSSLNIFHNIFNDLILNDELINKINTIDNFFSKEFIIKFSINDRYKKLLTNNKLEYIWFRINMDVVQKFDKYYWEGKKYLTSKNEITNNDVMDIIDPFKDRIYFAIKNIDLINKSKNSEEWSILIDWSLFNRKWYTEINHGYKDIKLKVTIIKNNDKDNIIDDNKFNKIDINDNKQKKQSFDNIKNIVYNPIFFIIISLCSMIILILMLKTRK